MQVDYLEAVKKHRFDLLYAGDRLAGLIETVPEGDYILIENVAVLPAFQGRGFGKRLLKLAEELAASAELTGVRLYTNKLFLQNIRLYEGLGYRVEREETMNGGIAVYMAKPLARPGHAPFRRALLSSSRMSQAVGSSPVARGGSGAGQRG